MKKITFCEFLNRSKNVHGNLTMHIIYVKRKKNYKRGLGVEKYTPRKYFKGIKECFNVSIADYLSTPKENTK